MKSTFFLFAFCISSATLFAQKETFDIVSYAVPKAWKKTTTDNSISYSITNAKTKTWCQISIVKSTISKGSIDQDFESEWQEMVVKNYNPTEPPQLNEVQEANGWKTKSGAAKFKFSNADAIAMLTTMSGFERCVSITAATNSQNYIKDIEALLASVDLIKPEVNPVQPEVTLPQTPNTNNDKNSILGTWGATASDNSNYRIKNGIMNYISRQYTFNEDGSYSFVSKAFDPLMDKILLGKENGNYQMSNVRNSTVTPA